MWFFMISCYILSLLTSVMLFAMLLQNQIALPFLKIPALTFTILTSIVYFFTETLVIFFFVGTGVSVRDYSKEKNLSDEYRQRSLAIKHKLYPPTMLNLLLMIVLFVLPGVIHIGKFQGMYYHYYFLLCLWHYVYTKIIQHQCFKENTENILAMSGIKRSI